MQHPHHAKVPEFLLELHSLNDVAKVLNSFIKLQVTPKFCKQFGQVGTVINKALLEYKEEVKNKSFPDDSHTPYKISNVDVSVFLKELQKMGLDEAASSAALVAESTTGSS